MQEGRRSKKPHKSALRRRQLEAARGGSLDRMAHLSRVSVSRKTAATMAAVTKEAALVVPVSPIWA
jgi:hypothetical protein